MKTKIYLSLFKTILIRNTFSHYACHPLIISKTNHFLGKSNQLRLSFHFHYTNFAANATVKLLNRSEVQEYLKLISDEFDKIENLENQVTPVLEICKQIKKYKNDLKTLKTLNAENDKEMENLIIIEEQNFINEINRLSGELLSYAVPRDDNSKSVTFLVIPGLGGQEAKLFAEEIFDLYLNYARYKDWEILCVHKSTADGGGINRAEAIISGESAFRLLKHEAGIHRVQRVPTTEKNGKMQTSTCKVNVVPDLEANEIVLEKKDLKFEMKTSSGPGGQNVNKVETCVRVTYIPTGLTVECQTERFQSANKMLALKKLKYLLYEEQQEMISSKVKDMKTEQAVTLQRSDKIRTYNFAQNRVTDHRINYSNNHIHKYMEGNKLLDEMILQLDANYQEEYIIRNIKRILKLKDVSELFKRKVNR